MHLDMSEQNENENENPWKTMRIMEAQRESKERYHQNHKKNVPRSRPVKLAVGKEKRKSRRKAQEESSVQKEGRGGVKRKKGRFLKRWGGVLEVV